jgi:DNA repair photolyase
LLRETAALCNLILDSTGWQIRLLSKSSLLARLFKDNLIPERHRHRMILGFSTGTLDDNVAAAIEVGTARVSKRIEALHWLQDEGYRTFGMICPSLPQADVDYVRFSREICEAIRVDRCEHVWAEVINLRGKSLVSTLAGLHGAGFVDQAEALSAVMGSGRKDAWEQYARDTFLAHTLHVPAEKLRFLQYVDDSTVDWWAGQHQFGAVLLGKAAERKNLTHVIG